MAIRPTAIIAMDQASFDAHFDDARMAQLEDLVDLLDRAPVADFEHARRNGLAGALSAAEVLITSWGAFPVTADRLGAMPGLRAVFHCAGSVRHLVDETAWVRGLTVTTAADINAVPVAEFTLAAIINAGKKAPFISRDLDAVYRGWGHVEGYGDLSNFRRDIGVVGYSRIGRRVVDLLRGLETRTVLVSDPHADPAAVAASGATLVDLDDLLPRVDILSLHAPELPSTRHLIGARELALLPDHATVINTARGSLIDSEALAAECASGRLYALLDVTDPEPLPLDSPLRRAGNVVITPHLAGSLGTELLRLTDHTLAELGRWVRGEPLVSQVSVDVLSITA